MPASPRRPGNGRGRSSRPCRSASRRCSAASKPAMDAMIRRSTGGILHRSGAVVGVAGTDETQGEILRMRQLTLVLRAAACVAAASVLAACDQPPPPAAPTGGPPVTVARSEEHTPEIPPLMRISYAVFGLTKK